MAEIVAPETGEKTAAEIAPIETETTDTLETGEIETTETEPETTPETGAETPPEPTLAEAMGEIKKLNSRVGFLQRKADRPGTRAPEKTEQPKAKPAQGDFEDYDEFIQASIDWGIDQRDTANATASQEQESQNKQDDFFSVIDSGPEKYSDFNEIARKPVADGGPEVNEVMLEAMSESDNPVDIAYWLGKNVAESERIARLSDVQAAREIGKLDAVLGEESSRLPQKTKTETVTPMKTVDGQTATEDNLENMPMVSLPAAPYLGGRAGAGSEVPLARTSDTGRGHLRRIGQCLCPPASCRTPTARSGQHPRCHPPLTIPPR